MAKFIGGTFFGGMTENNPTTTWQNRLWANGTTTIQTVREMADGLAAALGAQMRKSAQGPDMLRETRGETLVMTVCFKVNWGYLAFLAVFLVLGGFFLVAVVVINHRSRFHVELEVVVAGGGVSERRGLGAVDQQDGHGAGGDSVEHQEGSAVSAGVAHRHDGRLAATSAAKGLMIWWMCKMQVCR